MIYMFLADGFEEIEALCPLDLLRRAKRNVKTVGVTGMQVTGSHGITVSADIAPCDVVLDGETEMVILPGGMPGTLNLDADETVHRALEFAYREGKYLAAICAAPSVLGKCGYLRGKEAICYPGFESALEGAIVSEKSVVRDGNIITGKGMGVALPFGLKLVEALCGADVADSLKESVMAD